MENWIARKLFFELKNVIEKKDGQLFGNPKKNSIFAVRLLSQCNGPFYCSKYPILCRLASSKIRLN